MAAATTRQIAIQAAENLTFGAHYPSDRKIVVDDALGKRDVTSGTGIVSHGMEMPCKLRPSGGVGSELGSVMLRLVARGSLLDRAVKCSHNIASSWVGRHDPGKRRCQMRGARQLGRGGVARGLPADRGTDEAPRLVSNSLSSVSLQYHNYTSHDVSYCHQANSISTQTLGNFSSHCYSYCCCTASQTGYCCRLWYKPGTARKASNDD